jgi:hypothetical protein
MEERAGSSKGRLSQETQVLIRQLRYQYRRGRHLPDSEATRVIDAVLGDLGNGSESKERMSQKTPAEKGR